MATRANLGLVDAGAVLIRGTGTNVLLANAATVRDAARQLHVGPDRAWVKDLQVITSLTAPQITTLQNDVDAAEAEIAALQTRATTLEDDATALAARVAR